MKKAFLIIVIFFIVFNSSAQSWSYHSGGNAFDGKYKTASVKGYGTDYPYAEPLLVINMFNEESLNFYLSKGGYYQSTTGISILWAFSKEPETIYESADYTISDDGKTLFFGEYYQNNLTGDILQFLEFMEKLKTSNKVDIRIKDKYGKNDITFSLVGSSKAIGYVVSKEYKEQKLAQQEEILNALKESREKKAEINIKISMLLEKAGIINVEERDKMVVKIDSYFDFNELFRMIEIDSLTFDLNKLSAHLNLLNKEGGLIKKIYYVDEVIPKYIDNIRESEYSFYSSKIVALLRKYELNDFENQNVCDKIILLSELYKYDVTEIDSINILVELDNSTTATLELFNNKNQELHSFRFFEDQIPIYAEKVSTEIKNNAITRINSLLEKYELTQAESDEIYKEIDDKELFIIEVNKADRATMDNPNYGIDVKFFNGDKVIVELSVWGSGAGWIDKMGKKLKKIKSKSNKN